MEEREDWNPPNEPLIYLKLGLTNHQDFRYGVILTARGTLERLFLLEDVKFMPALVRPAEVPHYPSSFTDQPIQGIFDAFRRALQPFIERG